MTSEPNSAGAAQAAHRLAGYLTGTHSGGHAVRSTRRATLEDVSEGFHLDDAVNGDQGDLKVLGGDRWTPEDPVERRLRDSLVGCLTAKAFIDLVMFGSIARGSTTGYSDVDAILIVADDVIGDARRLRTLRSRVLAAGRAVLAYQPMQHHGFLVTTPRLLRNASAALSLPTEALETTSSLFGRPTHAVFGRLHPPPSERFHALARSLLRTTSWPDHAWHLHRTVAMFELAPALYLQASGRPCAKHRSFDIARSDFRGEWFAYDVLDEVRRCWPREPRLALRGTASALRNPWTATALWRRLPSRVPDSVAALLGEECLRGLQRVITAMAVRIR